MRISLTAASAAGLLVLTACSSGDTTADTTKQAIAVTASDDACVIDLDHVEAGDVELTVTNAGQQVTEVYVYGAEDRVIGELENITPGLTRSFTVTVGGGDYEIACKPGQTGDGIRTALSVSGEAIALPDATSEVEFDGVDYTYEGLEDVSFTAGEVILFEMHNTGTVEHEFEVFGPDGEVLGEIGPTAVGETGKLTLELSEAGTYRYVCGIDDHEDRGMIGEFTVA